MSRIKRSKLRINTASDKETLDNKFKNKKSDIFEKKYDNGNIRISNVKGIKRGKVKYSSFNDFEENEEVLENEAIMEDNMSILGICLIVILCFIVGIALGICLYRLAINNSGVALIINKVILKLFG